MDGKLVSAVAAVSMNLGAANRELQMPESDDEKIFEGNFADFHQKFK
jgi:hypothetical protein